MTTKIKNLIPWFYELMFLLGLLKFIDGTGRVVLLLCLFKIIILNFFHGRTQFTWK